MVVGAGCDAGEGALMVARVNAALDRSAVVITSAVGTMWCALIFALLALSSLSSSLGSVKDFVQWLSTTFLQLVLLSIIMVGQRVQGSQTRDHVTAHAHAVRAQVAREVGRVNKPASKTVRRPKAD